MKAMIKKDEEAVEVSSGLSRREEAAYRMHMQAKDPPLGSTLQEQFFNLYLNGMSCEQITRLNKGVRLGAVVRAYKEGDWHNKRQEMQDEAMLRVKERVVQVQVDATLFASDLLAVVHKRFGDKLKLYLQTGDESHLAGFAVNSLKDYAKVIEMLMGLTGQSGTKKVGGTIKVETSSGDSGASPDSLEGKVTAKVAGKLLGLLAAAEDGEDD